MQINPSEVITPFAEKIGHTSTDPEKQVERIGNCTSYSLTAYFK